MLYEIPEIFLRSSLSAFQPETVPVLRAVGGFYHRDEGAHVNIPQNRQGAQGADSSRGIAFRWRASVCVKSYLPSAKQMVHSRSVNSLPREGQQQGSREGVWGLGGPSKKGRVTARALEGRRA